jgi:prophage DNA circulation protein
MPLLVLDRTISWGELITIVLFLLGAALLFYLILAVANLVRILRNTSNLLEKNRDNIDKTLNKLPQISENAEKITTSLKNNMESIEKVITDVGKVSESVKKGVDTFQKDILGKAKIFVDIVDAVKKLFEKKKDAPPKKKKGTVYRYKYKKGEEKPEEVEILTNEALEKPYDGYDTVEEPTTAEEESVVAENDDAGQDKQD